MSPLESHDHWTGNVLFPIGSQYEPTMYLARLLRYWASKFLGVTTLIFWGHVTSSVTTSRDRWTHNMGFPIGGQFEPTVYFARFLRY